MPEGQMTQSTYLQIDACPARIDALEISKADQTALAAETAAREAADAAHDTLLADLIDGGAKNIIFFDGLGTSSANAGASYTSNGITFEIQSDGTVRVYGSIESGSSYCYLYTGTDRTNIIAGFDGKHVLSGNPNGASIDTYRLWYKVGSQASVSEPTNGTTLPAQTGETSAVLGLQVNAPQTDLDVVFSPMICAKAAWDISDKFVPYCPTNAELYAMIRNGSASVNSLRQTAQLTATPNDNDTETEGETK